MHSATSPCAWLPFPFVLLLFLCRSLVSHKTPCHPSPQKRIGTPAQLREPTRTPLLYSRPATRSPGKTPEAHRGRKEVRTQLFFLWGSRATGAPLSP